MKMNLKNKKVKKLKLKKIKLTSKNLFIFLISFSLVTLILGIIFFYFLNTEDKTLITTNIENYFQIKENYNYLTLLKDNLLKNTFNIFLIWILGISTIGVLATIFIYFCQIFSLGFTIGSIFYKYQAKGILGMFCYIFPSKIIYIITLFLLTFFAIKISYKLIKLCFTKEEINIKTEIEKYFKILLFSFITILFITLTTVFIDPLLIKLFTKL